MHSLQMSLYERQKTVLELQYLQIFLVYKVDRHSLTGVSQVSLGEHASLN